MINSGVARLNIIIEQMTTHKVELTDEITRLQEQIIRIERDSRDSYDLVNAKYIKIQNELTILNGSNLRLVAENEGYKGEKKSQKLFISESHTTIETYKQTIGNFEADKRALADENHQLKHELSKLKVQIEQLLTF